MIMSFVVRTLIKKYITNTVDKMSQAGRELEMFGVGADREGKYGEGEWHLC